MWLPATASFSFMPGPAVSFFCPENQAAKKHWQPKSGCGNGRAAPMRIQSGVFTQFALDIN
jgi:hypothetical protein